VRSEVFPSSFSLPPPLWPLQGLAREKKNIYKRRHTGQTVFTNSQNLTQISIESLNFAKWARTDTCSCRLFSQPSLLLLLIYYYYFHAQKLCLERELNTSTPFYFSLIACDNNGSLFSLIITLLFSYPLSLI
jgi:hypothetical protein